MHETSCEHSFLESLQTPGKPCIHPWFYLWINAAGDATVCPQNRIRLGSLEQFSLPELWNNETIRNIRQSFLEGDYEKGGCERECPYLRGVYTHAAQPIPPRELIFPDIDPRRLDPSGKASSNLRQGIEDYRSQRLYAEALPAVLDCQSILACNAGCIMCGQPHASKLKHSPKIKDEIEKAGQYLSAIRWQGGEVFLDKNFTHDVQVIGEAGDEAMRKIIITNGSLLDAQKIDAILNLRGDTRFIVSMDGAVPETVNTIRYHLDHAKIFGTITVLADRQKQVGRNDLVLWNYTVMRSNIDEVTLAITIADSLGVDINLAAIQGNYPNENFFEFPLVEPEQWERYLVSWEASAARASITVSGIEGLRHRYRC
ncbi:radical SAM protein [Sulfuricurvum sp. IAE1]|uniref:radical SAM protein n=1 Tax=Sulfuricurvum sp. IAE1 TaxID=2546102 RepID=UPI001045B1DB|nr:radical SAM protein [Sulfuricurvum sp. IAE1]TDA62657.1 radical SAM protein [Sulfuricurvum sp. IAE1]